MVFSIALPLVDGVQIDASLLIGLFLFLSQLISALASSVVGSLTDV